MVVLRLSAFIVLCIGVSITWNGVKALASELTAAPPVSTMPDTSTSGARDEPAARTTPATSSPR